MGLLPTANIPLMVDVGTREKFASLSAAFGLPRRAMRMTVVLDELHAGHAVLMVLTDRGDFILDNKTNAVLPWSDTPYDYHKREGAEGLAWVALSHQRAPVITAAKGATSLPVP